MSQYRVERFRRGRRQKKSQSGVGQKAEEVSVGSGTNRARWKAEEDPVRSDSGRVNDIRDFSQERSDSSRVEG